MSAIGNFGQEAPAPLSEWATRVPREIAGEKVSNEEKNNLKYLKLSLKLDKLDGFLSFEISLINITQTLKFNRPNILSIRIRPRYYYELESVRSCRRTRYYRAINNEGNNMRT